MSDTSELETALVNADKAGDTAAAKALVAEITRVRGAGVQQDPDIPVPGRASESAFVTPPEPEPTGIGGRIGKLARGYIGDVESAVSLLTGMVGGTFGLTAGGVNAAVQKMMGRGQPGKTVEESALEGARALTYEPRTQEGKQTLESVSRALEAAKIPAAWPLAGPLGMERAVTPGAVQAGKAAVRAGEAAEPVVSGAARRLGAAGADILGTRVGPARREAMEATRSTIEDAIGKAAREEIKRQPAISGVAKSLAGQVEAARGGTVDLDAQGGAIRQIFTKSMEDAKLARANAAKDDLDTVKQAAAAKEAAGQRVDTSAVASRIDKMLDQAEGIPDLKAGLQKMRLAVAPKVKEAAQAAGADFTELQAGLEKQIGETRPPAPKEFQAPSLLQVIRQKGGIAASEIRDLTGEGRAGRGVKGIPPTFFTKAGRTLDELASELRDEGWAIPEDAVDGGVQALRDMIQSEFAGEKQYSIADTDRFMAFQRDQEAAAAGISPEGARGVPPEPKGRTFEQLEIARRYLNDIAYGADMEGYPAILRGEARQAAKELADAMQQFVPEFAEYKKRYADLSKPLESLGTRFGKAIAATEGGLAEEAYAKVANADLPGRLLSKREGVDLMIDALSGGKANVSSEARAEATAMVSDMVVAWIRETSRTKAPTNALEALSEPRTRAALSSLPDVEASLKKQFGDVAGMDRAAKQMAEAAKKLHESGSKASQAARGLQADIERANVLASQPGAASQRKALAAYGTALDGARRANLLSVDQYRAARALIDRAETIEEKTMLARKIALGIGLPAVGYEAYKYTH